MNVLRALDEVLVQNPDQSIVLIESELCEEALSDLIDVADQDGGKEDLGQGHAAIQGGLDGGIEELTGVIVQEVTTRDHRPDDNDGPEGRPEFVHPVGIIF